MNTENLIRNHQIKPLSHSPFAHMDHKKASHEAVALADKAARAFSNWSTVNPEEKRKLLLNAAANIRKHSAELKKIAAEEVGSADNFLDMNIDIAVEFLQEAASLTTQINSDLLPNSSAHSLSLAVRQPVGVCLGIPPWNVPILLSVRAIALPLACGNTVILKASELCPKTHQRVIEIIKDSGFPENVINIITNRPDEAGDVVESLISHPAVRHINFTGSTRVGRLIAELSAKHLKRCILELSGKAPFIVLDDANLDKAVEAACYGAFMNQGQLCISTERVILQDPIADEFTQLFVAKAKTLTSGLNHDASHKLGALIDTKSGKRLQAIIDDAVEKGASVLCGGTVNGCYLDATVIDNVTPSMRIYYEECFGPLVHIVRCCSDDDALSIANDTEFGLAAAVFSQDTYRAMNIAKRIESGICHINSTTVADDARAPFGGMKSSGHGRFGGSHSINEFTESRWITIANDDCPPPQI
ncbi:aldehyde dehydrogenase [Marinomonas pollencensis]|uniref:Acyl-CoA reductase-like NAD-dependent aldehyde dehydrogenase n=1 Tax=Marinomonas pollencensis TaxID=491954 RepID=A0A3E0DIM8_9GAMM|nr:aldehyde dehydrogenase [Marinomonas pollencensis]REG81937.1 acyl-CoA reductase-like NAD-dependent aldehyde dehydrogenase [Marinomonas pollencensis]